MKVYGLTTAMSVDGRMQTCRVIVAAKSQKAAVEAFQEHGMRNMTLNHFRNYGSQTWNPGENEIALSQPGQPFVRADHALIFNPMEKR